MSATRRQRIRAATIAEIKEAALDQIASGGAASLSIRGVARAIGMSPAGLYRYYRGLHDLLTDLIADAYGDLADAVSEAAAQPGTHRQRLRAAMVAYRRWAVSQPHRFLLVFGTPVPGYAAPEGGETVEPVLRMGRAFFTVAVEAWRAGVLTPPARFREPETSEVELAEELAPGFPPEAVALLLGSWGHFHGLVTLELLGHLAWLYRDPEAFYLAEVDRILDGVLSDG